MRTAAREAVRRSMNRRKSRLRVSTAHRPRGIVWQQATPPEQAQQARAHLRRYCRDGMGIERGGCVEDDRACGGRVKHAGDDDAVDVQVCIERRVDAVDEGDRADASRGARIRVVRAGRAPRRKEEEQSSTLKFSVAFQKSDAFHAHTAARSAVT